MCHHNCHLNHKLPTFISLEHGTVSLIKQTFFPFASTNLWGTPLFVWKQKIQSFLSCDRHCMLGSTWLIQVSIVTLLVGWPCHLSHTSHKRRTKSKQAQTYQNCEVCWKISNGFGRRFLIERTVSLLHISEQEEVLWTLKDWLSSYSKMLEK